MFKIVNLHLRYFFTKNNLVVFVLLISAYAILALFKSKFYIDVNEQILYKESYQNQYDYLMLTIYKLVIVVFSTYIFSLIKSNSYFVLLSISKLKYHLTKVFSNIVIILCLFLGMFFIYYFFAKITKWYTFNFDILRSFVLYFIQGIIYGLITNNLCYILKTNFAFIFAFFLYVACENILDLSIFSQIISIVIPVNLNLRGNYIYLPLMLFLYFLTSFYLYERSEIY